MANNNTIITDAKEAFSLLDQSLIWQPDLSINDPVRPPIFISFEMDGVGNNISQIGVSIFDPCWLASRNHDRRMTNEAPITTALYLGHFVPKAKHERQIMIVPRSRRLKRSELRSQLMRALAPTDASGRQRNVVLVGHNIIQQVKAIKNVLAIDVRNISTVRAVLSTQIFSKYVLKSTQPPNLAALLSRLNLRHGPINHKAHASRCSLRTLFSMYYELKSAHTELMEILERLSVIEEIAKFDEPGDKLIWNGGERRYEIKMLTMNLRPANERNKSSPLDLF